MMTMFQKLLLKTGLFEPKSTRPDGQPSTLVIVAGETVTGGIQTRRDVEVRGHVQGDISTPYGRVVIMPEGLVTQGTVRAHEVVWKGTMGGSEVHCSHIEIVPGAQSVEGEAPPTLFHESITIGKVGAIDLSLSRQAYVANPQSTAEPDGIGIVAVTEQEMLAA
ncbi:polymer-forming cytoskeletal protein [Curvibacter sp. APW13]|uniref:bactofilin family protein n=1 Tax=Curvibacter sp. APW13 TaxID=3077236 RepID=UPI0028DE79E3|nr:polymer-forming cytoskeletal protein [Curvibacter sp. APW13]MDT8992743.1 polymer-forming cytoskeletal protein [Curvibacter sp. APW13]